MKRYPSPGSPGLVFIILLLLACTVPDTGRADEPFAKVGVYAGTFLRFPRGARSISLGGSGVADPSTPMNIYYNPAVAFLIDGIHAVQGYNEWPLDIDLQDYGAYTGRSYALGTTTDIRIGGGIRYTHLNVNAAVERTIFLPSGTGRTFGKDYYLTMTVGSGVSTRWIDTGIGFSAKPTNLVGEWIWTYDMGFLARFNLPDVAGVRFVPSVGAGFLNFNEDVELLDYIARLPHEIRLGAALRIESPASESFERHLGVRGPVAALSGIYEHMDRKYDSGIDGGNYGVELTFLDAFSMRVGHSDQIFGYESSGTTYGMGFGWWFRMVRVQFDVASFITSSSFADSRNNIYGISIMADI